MDSADAIDFQSDDFAKETCNKVNIMKKSRNKSKKKEHTIFIRNLTYTTTREDILEHFKKYNIYLDDVRLVLDKDNKFRGFGFLDLPDAENYENAFLISDVFINRRRFTLGYVGHNKQFVKAKNLKLKAIKRQYVLKNPTDGQKRRARRKKKEMYERQMALK